MDGYQPLLPTTPDMVPVLKQACEDNPETLQERLALLSQSEKSTTLGTLLLWAAGTDIDAEGKVKILLQASANPNDVFKHSPSVLWIAATRNDSKVLEQLLEAGARIPQSLALHAAAQSGSVSNMDFLVENGADINEVDFKDPKLNGDKSSKPPIFYTTHFQKLDAAKWLLDNGADVKLKNSKEQSIVEYSRVVHEGGWPGLEKLLKERGIDVE